MLHYLKAALSNIFLVTFSCQKVTKRQFFLNVILLHFVPQKQMGCYLFQEITPN